MFTGIIEETGTIRGISQGRDSAFITVGASKVLEGTVKGDSIAVNGVCLTVTSLAADSFTADAMPETLRRSSLGRLVPGSKVNLERAKVNLERAMQAGGRFGGHIVSGHVDACCRVLSITAAGIAKIVRIAVPEDLSALIAVKGSVAVDGASLTVTESGTDYFAVSLIPHTASASTLGNVQGIWSMWRLMSLQGTFPTCLHAPEGPGMLGNRTGCLWSS